MFKRLLVPYDGSEFSDRALELALEVARDADAEITLCYVMESTVYVADLAYGTMDTRTELEAREQTGIELLAASSARAKRAGVNATTKLLAGEIVSAILELARSINADLIVMGSHGRSGWETSASRQQDRGTGPALRHSRARRALPQARKPRAQRSCRRSVFDPSVMAAPQA
jgi:nucleotide-binding universal stress UspA family protein